MKNVLLYDSHPISLMGLRLVLSELEADINVLGTNLTSEFNQILDSRKIDLVVFGVNDQSNLGNINKKYIRCQSWIICYHENEYKSALELLTAGSKGCIAKGRPTTDLLACINTVLEGNEYVCKTTLELTAAEYLKNNGGIDGLSLLICSLKARRRIRLSPREEEIADLLTKGMRTSHIADKLMIKNSTVSTIKGQIFRKMKVSNVMELASVM